MKVIEQYIIYKAKEFGINWDNETRKDINTCQQKRKTNLPVVKLIFWSQDSID